MKLTILTAALLSHALAQEMVAPRFSYPAPPSSSYIPQQVEPSPTFKPVWRPRPMTFTGIELNPRASASGSSEPSSSSTHSSLVPRHDLPPPHGHTPVSSLVTQARASSSSTASEEQPQHNNRALPPPHGHSPVPSHVARAGADAVIINESQTADDPDENPADVNGPPPDQEPADPHVTPGDIWEMPWMPGGQVDSMSTTSSAAKAAPTSLDIGARHEESHSESESQSLRNPSTFMSWGGHYLLCRDPSPYAHPYGARTWRYIRGRLYCRQYEDSTSLGSVRSQAMTSRAAPTLANPVAAVVRGVKDVAGFLLRLVW